MTMEDTALPVKQKKLGEDLLRNMFSCIDSRNWQELAKYFHDKIVYYRPGYEPFVGKEAVMNFYETKRIISKGEHLIEKVLVDGNVLSCFGSFTGTSKKGKDLNVRFTDTYELHENRIIKRETFFNTPAV